MNTVRLDLLRFLYGDAAAAVDAALADLIARHAEASYAAPALERSRRRWDHRDAILITYADSIRSPGEAPLSVLASVLPTITGSPALAFRDFLRREPDSWRHLRPEG